MIKAKPLKPIFDNKAFNQMKQSVNGKLANALAREKIKFERDHYGLSRA